MADVYQMLNDAQYMRSVMQYIDNSVTNQKLPDLAIEIDVCIPNTFNESVTINTSDQGDHLATDLVLCYEDIIRGVLKYITNKYNTDSYKTLSAVHFAHYEHDQLQQFLIAGSWHHVVIFSLCVDNNLIEFELMCHDNSSSSCDSQKRGYIMISHNYITDLYIDLDDFYMMRDCFIEQSS